MRLALFTLLLLPSLLSANDLVKAQKDRTVAIKALPVSHGTGFWVDRHHIVTADHVLDKAKSVRLFPESYLKTQLTIKRRYKKWDLAILHSSAPGPDLPPLKLGAEPDYLDRLFMWASPPTFDPCGSQPQRCAIKSYVSVKRATHPVGYEVVVGGHMTIPGCSGAPVYNKRGELVGVARGTICPSGGKDCPFIVIVSLRHLRELLRIVE